MRSPARASAGVIAAFALVVLGTAVAGCGLVGPGQGDPAAPVLIQGRVVDQAGQGRGGASLQLSVHDFSSVEVGQRVPALYSGSFSAGPDGSFALRLAPTPDLVAFAARNGGYVNFELFAEVSGGFRPWAFPRELEAGTWAGSIPAVVVTPDGVTEPGADPGVPVPLPEET